MDDEKQFKRVDRIEVAGDIWERFMDWWHRPSRKDLVSEIARLTEKCRERSDECFLLRTQLGALNATVEHARGEYQNIRRQVPNRILDGKREGAVHEDRIEYENNRLRVFGSTAFRLAQELMNEHVRLNKDLERSKTAVLGGMLQDDPKPS